MRRVSWVSLCGFGLFVSGVYCLFSGSGQHSGSRASARKHFPRKSFDNLL